MSGLVIRKNLFPSPLFSHYQKSVIATTDIEVADGVITVNGTDTSRSYVEWTIRGLDPGARMVFRCRCEPVGEWPQSGGVIWVYRSDWVAVGAAGDITVSQIADGVAFCEFDAPADGVVGVRFRAMNGTRFSEPLLEAKSTFDESLPFFYHGTMPYPRSA